MNDIRIYFYNFIQRKRISKKILFMIRAIVALLISKIIKKYRGDYCDVWLLGTGDDRYENNIRSFDCYLRNKGEKVIWVIDKSNRNEEMWRGFDVVYRGSIKNYLIALNCYCCVFSHGDWDVAPGIFRIMKKRNPVLLYVEHAPSGIKKSPSDLHSKIPVDIQCCLSKYERLLKLNEGAREETTKITGFAGYDDYSIRESGGIVKSILVMPTWRDWDLNGNRDFKSTKLYQTYYRLFNNKSLANNIQSKKIKVTFILHPTAARYYQLERNEIFNNTEVKVNVITGNDGRMREEITNADMLVTDYSTLSLDFLYMKKPVMFFCYDYDEYHAKHGLLVKIEELGDAVCINDVELVKKIKIVTDDYTSYNIPTFVNSYFDFHDHNNCKRIFEEVKKVHISKK